MGSLKEIGEQDEHPRHEVTLSAYCIDKTEVTVKAYSECVAAKGCAEASCTDDDDVKLYSQFCNGDDCKKHPVNCVDWRQAKAYCEWAGKRLPTEAEWEYAARGREQDREEHKYPWGNDAPSEKRLNACGRECVEMANKQGWPNEDWKKMYDGSDGRETTAKVGSFPAGASPFGVLDMAGNVWEWTADWYGSYPGAAVTDPHGPETGTKHVLRGGGWSSGVVDRVRAAYRDSDEASHRAKAVGFRCARGIEQRAATGNLTVR